MPADMAATRLDMIRVEKPWGRSRLWPGFDDPSFGAPPVGEIWFNDSSLTDRALMVKYLFTSERLSIQVHPDDALAQRTGHPHGKEEAWIVLDAIPDARLGLGTVEPIPSERLRAAALSGEIEALIDWKPVRAGDVILVTPGTVHAIGAGLTLIEIQQNIDLTYRLYDYGRPRALHLDEGVAAARAVPFINNPGTRPLEDDRALLVQCPHFIVEQWRWQGARRLAMPEAVPGWLTVARGGGAINGRSIHSGEGWLIEGEAELDIAPETELLFAYVAPQPLPLFNRG